MKNIKLIDFYKLKDNSVSIRFSYKDEEIEIFINPSSLSKLKKCLKEEKISNALKIYKKNFKNKDNTKKKSILKNKFDSILKTYNIEYSFIGSYLLSVFYENVNYLIDFYNDSLEVCCILEKYGDTAETVVSTESVENSEEDVNILNKIKTLNETLPTDLEGLIKFSMNNSDVVKPILQIFNSKTDNFIGSIIDSLGVDYSLKNKINIESETIKISNCMKIIEDLNNNDISSLTTSDQKKFNYIISQIWVEIKNIITILDNLKPDNDLNSILEDYKEVFLAISFKNEMDENNIKISLINMINSLFDNVIELYITQMESKYLELNILIQDDMTNSSNNIVNNKLENILHNNYSLYAKFFTKIYKPEDVFNIFSDFNKDIGFHKISSTLDKSKISKLILRIEDLREKIINLDQIENFYFPLNINFDKVESNRYDKYFNSLRIETTSIIDYFYINFRDLIDSILKDREIFIDKINIIYNTKLLSNKKRDLSLILKKFHEEILFRLSIIKKVLDKKD